MNYSNLTFEDLKKMSDQERSLIFNNVELLKEMLQRNVSEHRYLHSLSVAETAKKLALAHNVDVNKAYMAGLLHDVCKFPDQEILEKYLEKYEPNKLNGIYGAYHSWVAYYYLKECGYKDEEVLRAIYNHTILEEYNPLNVIIYIADKREPLRNIDDDILETSMKDLDLGYSKLKLNVYAYLKETGKINE